MGVYTRVTVWSFSNASTSWRRRRASQSGPQSGLSNALIRALKPSGWRNTDFSISLPIFSSVGNAEISAHCCWLITLADIKKSITCLAGIFPTKSGMFFLMALYSESFRGPGSKTDICSNSCIGIWSLSDLQGYNTEIESVGNGHQLTDTNWRTMLLSSPTKSDGGMQPTIKLFCSA